MCDDGDQSQRRQGTCLEKLEIPSDLKGRTYDVDKRIAQSLFQPTDEAQAGSAKDSEDYAVTDSKEVMSAEEDRDRHAGKRNKSSIHECAKRQQACFDHASGASCGVEICDNRRDNMLSVRSPQQVRYCRDECCQTCEDICNRAFQNTAASRGCNGSMEFIPYPSRHGQAAALLSSRAKKGPSTAQ
jgi:hypothetical protein